MFCDGSCNIPGTSGFGWFWIKVYFPIEVVLSHAKYFLAGVQLALSHRSMQFTGFMPAATSPCLEVKHVAAVAGEALWQLPWAWVVFSLNVQCPLSAGCATHEVKLQLSRGYWSALKGRFGIKWCTEVQELPEKEYCLRQRCSWVWLEERPLNNSDNLFSYLVMA